MTEGEEMVATRLERAMARGMNAAGTLPASQSVKVRPSDWHELRDSVAEAAALIASQAADLARKDDEIATLLSSAAAKGDEPDLLLAAWREERALRLTAEAALAKAVEDEREACAKLVEQHRGFWQGAQGLTRPAHQDELAEAIRARSLTPTEKNNAG